MKMTKPVHHYMVDFEGAEGVTFANDAPLTTLDEAKALAKQTSLTVETGSAAAVAFTDKGDGTYEAVGHVMFHHGEVSDVDGVIA
jgi:predicted deacylase